MAAPTAVHDAMELNHGSGQPIGMDAFGHELGFDESLLDGSSLVPLPFAAPYDFDPFTSTFEDPFSYSARSFEPVAHQDIANDEVSPQDLDNKLLGFSEPIMHATLVDETGKFAEVAMSAELYGMFFVAEDVFGGETLGRPLELTCYRRNLWQCSGQITLTRAMWHVVDEQGLRFPIVEFAASITAVESIEGKATEIISIPWKSANPQLTTEESSKTAASPPSLTLDPTAGQELDANRVSLPVSWKRLQFKHATANNGRRKGLQQHYVVQINLLGRTKTGETIKVAEIQSGPVIVRGRSPRNFDSRKDVPLSGDKRTMMDRKGVGGCSDATSIKTERDGSQTGMSKFQSMGGTTATSMACATTAATPSMGVEACHEPGIDWAPTPQSVSQSSQSPHPAKRMATSPAVSRPPVPVPAWSADSIPGGKVGHSHRTLSATSASSSLKQNTAVPISLSLSEDEKSSCRSSAELQSPQLSKVLPGGSLNASNSPAEEADLLYEYFPLSVDDWMPPIDAIYRPHIVHHTIVPAEHKAQQIRSKAKRYFAAD